MYIYIKLLILLQCYILNIQPTNYTIINNNKTKTKHRQIQKRKTIRQFQLSSNKEYYKNRKQKTKN